ncbi:hypothetical protein [Crocosphaera sp. XPORK-15E]|nr:hypothetical protein [Crocosphaera sp. XPORK-15E]MEA5535422.1 hypothetical protein [Crocosphaera sp. XPORK-15E]
MLKTLAKLYETDFVAWTEETTKLKFSSVIPSNPDPKQVKVRVG